MAAPTPATEADLMRMPDDGWKYELVDGEIRRLSPAGGRHGQICARLLMRLSVHVAESKQGHVYETPSQQAAS